MAVTAYLFPGQGSQFVGMGKDLAERFESAARVFESAAEVLDSDLTAVMFGNGGDSEEESAQLRQTENTQPALFVHSMAVFEVLSGFGLEPDVTAGHSLGEYTALAAAGAISFEDGLRVVRYRGELMARAGKERPGAMAAILGAEDEVVDRICKEISAKNGGVVAPANYNAPGQVVISGDAAAVAEAQEKLREAGARKTVSLPVSGAFHSPLMEDAREELSAILDDLNIEKPRNPVYMNVDARPTQDPDVIRKNLLEQLTAPVQWTATLEAMRQNQVDRHLEVGAGNVLSGLVKRTIGRDAQVAAIGTVESIEALIQKL